MFIKIEKPKLPIVINDIIRNMHRCNIEFTDDVLINFLKYTNHPISIRDLLKEFDNIPDNELYKFKSELCSMVERRIHHDKNFEKMKNLANKGGFLDEFMDADKKIKYQKPSHNPVKIFEAIDDSLIPDDLSSYDVLRALNCRSLRFSKLPKILDFSNNISSSLFFSAITNKDNINLEDTIFVAPKNEISIIDFYSMRSLPKSLDLSKCNRAIFRFCNLSKTNITFKEGASVIISYPYGVPTELDFTKCSRVDLSNSSLNGCDKITFGKGSMVILDNAEDLPSHLDFSMCKNVSIKDAHLNGVKRITFRDKIQEATILRQSFFNYENPEIVYKNNINNIFQTIFGIKKEK